MDKTQSGMNTGEVKAGAPQGSRAITIFNLSMILFKLLVTSDFLQLTHICLFIEVDNRNEATDKATED